MMLKFLILGKNAVARHIGMSLLLVLQVICILVGSNMLLASYNQQFILIKPFQEWLSSEGYYIANMKPMNGSEKEEDGLMTKLHGEWKEINFYRETDFNIHEGNDIYTIKVLVYDNDFWDDYVPVMKSGRWRKSSYSGDKPWCIATPNIYSLSIMLPNSKEEIVVKGVMGDLCYIPRCNNWSRNGTVSDNFYSKYSSKRDETMYILMPESQWQRLRVSDKQLNASESKIIIPERMLTDEEKIHNEEVFREYASPQLPMSTLKERAKNDINDRLQRFLPLLIAQLTITLFGIICATAIQTLSDEKTFSIYGLCGMNHKKRLLINLSEYGILLLFSGAVTYIVYFVTKMKGMHAKYGLMFQINNLALSVAIICILLSVSLTAPYIITRNKRLADQLRRETQ